MSLVESQKGAINIPRCSVENQKGAITIPKCSVENQKGHYRCMTPIAIAPFWFSTEYL